MTNADAVPTNLPFTDADMTSAIDWHPRFRAIGVRLGINLNYEGSCETIEVGEPGLPHAHDPIRSTIERNTLGVWIGDAQDSDPQHAATMDDALGLVLGEIVDTLRAAAEAVIAAIPATLFPPLPASLRWKD